MAIRQPLKISGQKPRVSRANLTEWKGGYNAFLDSVRQSKNALVTAKNLILDQDGVPKRRPGTRNFGDPLTGVIDADSTFARYDKERKRLIEYNIAIMDGKVYTSESAKDWMVADGNVELTVGSPASLLAIDDKVLIGNGVDSLAYYDASTNKVDIIEAIDNPDTPSLTRSDDLSDGNITCRYQVTAINAVGETTANVAASISVNKQRSTWQNTTGTDSKSQNITLEWSNVEGAIRYNIYYSDAPGQTYYIDSIGASDGEKTTYIDEARSTQNLSLPIPEENGTAGPKLAELSYSDNRVFGVLDPDHPYRVHWGGLADNLLAFNWYFGGGWVDIGRGGDQIPTKVKSYRDGKGEPINTIFMTDASGVGEQFQVTLSTITTGEATAVVPMLARVIGSYGTPAPGSVVEAQNNLFYINKYAVNTTGAKADIYNVLSTDEVSLAMRPLVRSINTKYLSKAQAVFLAGKIYFAVPYGSTDNSEIWILDLELKAWIRQWTIPAKKLIIYTGEDGVQRLLYRPSSVAEEDSYLVEISDSFDDDNGQEFDVEMETPLIQWDASHMQFQRVKKVYIELLKSIGPLDIEISGAMKNKEVKLLRSYHIGKNEHWAGLDDQLWDEFEFDDAPTKPTSERSNYVKRVMKVRKTLNNIQFKIKAKSHTDWCLSVISIYGIPKNVSDPSRWKK